MQQFGTPFGAFGTAAHSRGEDQSVLDQYVGDCPVPQPDLFLGGTSAGLQSTWCDCVYAGYPELNTLCKLRLGDVMPNGDTYGDPFMPWSISGKRTRGLTNDALGQLLQEGMRRANQVARDAQADIAAGRDPTARYGTGGGGTGGGPAVVPLNTQDTHPAGPLSLDTSSRSRVETARETFQLLRQGGATAIRHTTPPGWTMPSMPSFDVSSNTLLMAGGAFAVWWFFLRPKTRISVGGFGGLRRRRSRRSRR